jgi:hypothetical protein
MQSDEDNIANELVLVRQEMRVLRETLDELKTTLEWAVQNGKLSFHFAENAANERTSPPSSRVQAQQATNDTPPEPGSLF